MNHIGDATLPETIAYCDGVIKKITEEKRQLQKENAKLIGLLDELCAHAEPVCDSLEMGQTLKLAETLATRIVLNAAWAAIPEL